METPDLSIDPLALDVEWLEQPQRFMEAAEQAAGRRRNVDKLKDELEFVRAELSKKIRSDPGKYGLDKITEAAVVAAVIEQADFIEVNSECVEARYELDMANAEVRALDQRKVALENLVRLMGQEYFAAPSEPRDLGLEYERRAKGKKAKDKIKGRGGRTK